MAKWYQYKEQHAGKFRLGLLWFIYKILGVRFLKLILIPISYVIYLISKSIVIPSKEYIKILQEYQKQHKMPISRFSCFDHIYSFATSLVDKMSSFCDKHNNITVDIVKNNDWYTLQKLINKNTGIFFISSHLGNVEALAKIPDQQHKIMHAFMQISQNSIFHKFLTNKTTINNTIIHSIDDIGIETPSIIYNYLQEGHFVMMAGDRISPKTPSKYKTCKLIGRECEIPLGVFKFAKLLEYPVFTICVANTSKEHYMLHVKQLDTNDINNMVNTYTKFLEKHILLYPKCWFNFFNFFK